MSDTVQRPAAPSTANCTPEQYDALYERSVQDPDGFWLEQAKERLDWYTAPTKGAEWSYDPVDIKWFSDGTLNICYNAVDRHLDTHGDQIALIFEPDSPDAPGRSLTYRQLHKEVTRVANALKAMGVRKGDRVTLYMPMIVEGALTMLACARIGAIHSVVFGGFSPEALAGRIMACESRFVVCADQGLRGSKTVPLKANVDAALAMQGVSVDGVLVFDHTGGEIEMVDGRDHWFADFASDDECPCEEMNAEDPLFILYTSGSTGTPKGVLHTTGGYALWAATTFHYTFDYQPGDIFWCSADIGWVTGHTYVTYGPLINAGTSLIFEGVPNYPDHGRFWDVIDKHKVNLFYTAPTAIRALMREGDSFVTSRNLSSLRVLGTVGEPINPEAWRWYYEVVGKKNCPIVDTWWQTETGGHMITTLPYAHDMKPGSAGKPFFGIQPLLVDNDGNTLEGATEGNLCITHSWPGQARTVYGDHDRFEQAYFSTYPGRYFTGDGCRRDEDGYYWITGRVDDVINVSGHRMGTAEVESALVLHPKVAEAAVVGYPHDIKGQGIYCYVTLNAGEEGSDELYSELRQHVRKEIGPIATPDHLQFTDGLPKTRSGKIMRRILRKIAENDYGSLGDTSTLADPSLVDRLIEGRQNR
ncbi:acetate--CoA ligase [Aurantiacibacter gangjinensis]|uniref:Acetyl-coenzyme A synthetase n=1 Tax=Aurantiacibacter gangjinensis TaxID=502682 RepID=A0A0G9MV36_9SPHN|nr:acetate--CoA ligase [Aurantiacibacter gangjinensis]APE29030.1 Acetyl-coenzyme A synthetase [Aurantiacibacter gangjinensis]KLE33128.1 acetyl-CoA synthetase [Aurantiacibacter gangjinensis]